MKWTHDIEKNGYEYI